MFEDSLEDEFLKRMSMHAESTVTADLDKILRCAPKPPQQQRALAPVSSARAWAGSSGARDQTAF